MLGLDSLRRLRLVQRLQPLLAQRVSFITETVFSHESKLDLLRNAERLGYLVTLHAVMIPEDLAVARVADRALAGGHLVPEDKIRGRYEYGQQIGQPDWPHWTPTVLHDRN